VVSEHSAAHDSEGPFEHSSFDSTSDASSPSFDSTNDIVPIHSKGYAGEGPFEDNAILFFPLLLRELLPLLLLLRPHLVYFLLLHATILHVMIIHRLPWQAHVRCGVRVTKVWVLISLSEHVHACLQVQGGTKVGRADKRLGGPTKVGRTNKCSLALIRSRGSTEGGRQCQRGSTQVWKCGIAHV